MKCEIPAVPRSLTTGLGCSTADRQETEAVGDMWGDKLLALRPPRAQRQGWMLLSLPGAGQPRLLLVLQAG